MSIEDCTIHTDEASFSVQTVPPLVIETVKATGEEIHHVGEKAYELWARIKEFAQGEITHEIDPVEHTPSLGGEDDEDPVAA